MKQYEFIIVGMAKNMEIQIMCTSNDALKWINTIVAQEHSATGEPYLQMPSGDILGIRYTGLKGISNPKLMIGWWIIQQLCQQGWEPFDIKTEEIYQDRLESIAAVYHLRREVGVGS
jgi:hypothetical protein